MQRILTIASREYRAMVATKAFLFTIACMPVLMMGGMFVPALMQKLQSREPRHVVIIDETGSLYAALEMVADERNKEVAEPEQDEGVGGGFDDLSPYKLEEYKGGELTDAARLELSDRIREGDLYAFVEIPADVMKPASAEESSDVIFYSEDAALSDMRRWVQRTLNNVVRAQRLEQAGIDTALVARAVIPVDVESVGLLERSDAGEIIPAQETDELATIFLPMGIMMLMFMVIFLAAQPMLEAVLEEKSQRIAEVLLGCVNAQQLMMGKLLGNVGGSLTVFVLYAGGAWSVAASKGWTDRIPFEIVPYFVIYQILGVLFFSSIFMAIGATVSQLKEAQSLLLPVWMVMFIPLFVWFNVIRDPNGAMATVISFFPPATPLMMTLRLATGAVIPIWQILGSIVVLIAATFVIVTAAARIFQIGILWQGKTPKPSEVVKWLFRNPLVGS